MSKNWTQSIKNPCKTVTISINFPFCVGLLYIKFSWCHNQFGYQMKRHPIICKNSNTNVCFLKFEMLKNKTRRNLGLLQLFRSPAAETLTYFHMLASCNSNKNSSVILLFMAHKEANHHKIYLFLMKANQNGNAITKERKKE